MDSFNESSLSFSQGIEVLYNRLWTRSSIASIRWLHLLTAFGAIISILMLFASPIARHTDDPISTTTPSTLSFRLCIVKRSIQSLLAALVRHVRQDVQNIADLLASMPNDAMNETLVNRTTTSTTLSNESLSISALNTTTTKAVVMKPSVVETDQLKQSLVAKPNVNPEQPSTKTVCFKSFCCYSPSTMYNDTQTNLTLLLECQEQSSNQSNECKTVLSTCQTAINVCQMNTTLSSQWCRVDQVCNNHPKPNCSIPMIEAAIAASQTTTGALTTTTTSTTTMMTTTTATTLTTTTTTTTTTVVTTTTTTTTTATTPTTHRNKPSMAESNKDDLSENLFLKKMHMFFSSITLIHFIYLFIALCFFLLAIFYSVLAIQGEGMHNTSKSSITSSWRHILFGHSHRSTSNHNSQLSLFADRASWKFVSVLLCFYFLLAGLEQCGVYLTYIFGMELKYLENRSLVLQFLFLLGLLFGRLIDIAMEYGCFLFNTRITNRTKKQSDRFHLISIKFCILIRLIVLLVICSTLSFSHLFRDNTNTTSSFIPSLQMFYFIFFLIGLLIASLPVLVLVWIERDLSLNDSLVRLILMVMTLGEIIFPAFLLYIIKHMVLSYVFYLFLGSCALFALFIGILYSGKRWQRKKLYRILPTSMEIDEIEIENISDHEQDDNPMRNGRSNTNGTKLTVDNERAKGSKGH